GPADGADGDGLDGRVRALAADGGVAGGRAAVRSQVAADRPVERPVPGRAVVPAGGPGDDPAAAGAGVRRGGAGRRWGVRRVAVVTAQAGPGGGRRVVMRSAECGT